MQPGKRHFRHILGNIDQRTIETLECAQQQSTTEHWSVQSGGVEFFYSCFHILDTLQTMLFTSSPVWQAWPFLARSRVQQNFFTGASAEWAKNQVRQVRSYTQIVSPGAPFMSHQSRCGKRLPVNLHVLCTNTQNHYICAYVQMLVKMLSD